MLLLLLGLPDRFLKMEARPKTLESRYQGNLAQPGPDVKQKERIVKVRAA